MNDNVKRDLASFQVGLEHMSLDPVILSWLTAQSTLLAQIAYLEGKREGLRSLGDSLDSLHPRRSFFATLFGL